MKKLLTALTLSCFALTANAEYTLKIPLEQAQGGSLPNGSILFINQPTAPIENWVAIEPLSSDWYTIGEPFDCQPDGWVPEPSTIAEGIEFTQTNQWCYIRGERTVQSREQETTTGIIRNVGDAEIESWNLDASDTRDSIGTASPWEIFATEQNLGNDWNSLDWGMKSLTNIPNSPYPMSNIDELNLSGNQLTNVDGLSNLTSVNNLGLGYNQLTNVNGLSNLTSVSWFGLENNQLTNVAGLSNLTSVGYLRLFDNQLTNVEGLSNLTNAGTIYLDSNQLTNVNGLSNLTSVSTLGLGYNQLTNVDGLANVKVSSQIRIDATYSGPKLAANTRFCTENPNSVFPPDATLWAQKTQLCESP